MDEKKLFQQISREPQQTYEEWAQEIKQIRKQKEMTSTKGYSEFHYSTYR